MVAMVWNAISDDQKLVAKVLFDIDRLEPLGFGFAVSNARTGTCSETRIALSIEMYGHFGYLHV